MNDRLMIFFSCVQMLNFCFMYNHSNIYEDLFKSKKYSKFCKFYCFIFIPTLVNISLFFRPLNSLE